jgi:hypothetical protein
MPRRYAIALAVLCLTVLLVSVAAMADKVADFNRSEERTLWMLKGVNLREFLFAGRPVKIEDVRAQQGEAVRVVYGAQELVIQATIPPKDERLPGLKRHEDWMQLVRFADQGRDTSDEFRRKLDAGEVKDRLTIVVRRPLADDPRTLGQGWKKQWVFDFYEFLPEGGFATETWAYPSGRTIDKIKEGALQEGSWQYAAALSVMPKLRKPNPRFGNDALHAMEWTLPAAAFSGLGLLVALLFVVAPRRQTQM